NSGRNCRTFLPPTCTRPDAMDAAARKTSNAEPDVAALERQAAELRGQVIWMSHKAKAAHLASCLSAIDILTAAYWHALRIDPRNPADPLRDRFILSKGHAAMALYSTLA